MTGRHSKTDKVRKIGPRCREIEQRRQRQGRVFSVERESTKQQIAEMSAAQEEKGSEGIYAAYRDRRSKKETSDGT